MNLINFASGILIFMITRTVLLIKDKKPVKAIAVIDTVDISYNKIKGKIIFEEINNHVKININLSGLEPNSSHAVHIHEFGSKLNGCDDMGAHYNPKQTNHGGPIDSEHSRHNGDLGNITSDSNGNINIVLLDNLIKLIGPISIIGRGIVIHEGIDDLGKENNQKSLENGNSGKRIACGSIVYMKN